MLYLDVAISRQGCITIFPILQNGVGVGESKKEVEPIGSPGEIVAKTRFAIQSLTGHV